MTFNPETDLRLERIVPLTPDQIYAAWTTPALMLEWFVPKPWGLKAVEIDPRPGGAFNSTMLSPDGDEYPNQGCVLEAVPGRRLVFTDGFSVGFRPNAEHFMTAIIEMEPHSDGAVYRATCLHKNAEDRQKHADMGFETGWGAALDQMVELLSHR